jgi:hypothetical protein
MSHTTATLQHGGKGVLFNERERHEPNVDYWLDIALEDSFPCSDPIFSMRTD